MFNDKIPKRVLLVDENNLESAEITSMLESSGFVVKRVHGAVEGLGLLRSNADGFDFILANLSQNSLLTKQLCGKT